MENVFGIQIDSDWQTNFVLLCTMEQRPMFLRDIVLNCVVLHNILGTYESLQVNLQYMYLMKTTGIPRGRQSIIETY